MKAYKGSRGIAPLIRNLGAQDGNEWLTSHPGSFYNLEISSVPME